MRAMVCGLVLFVALSGCSSETVSNLPGALDTPESNSTSQKATNGTGPEAEIGENGLPILGLFVTLDENLTAGQLIEFNLTSDDDAANATWGWEIYAGTVNLTAAILAGDGFGLPAAINFTLSEAGNYTLRTWAHAPEFDNGTLDTAFSVLAALGEPNLDPCATALVQEPIAKSIDMHGGAAGGTNTRQHIKFDVNPCQTKMKLDFDYDMTSYDLDLYLDDPSGAQRASKTSFDYPEGSITISKDVTPGEWDLEVYEYLSAPVGSFSVTITFG